MRRLQAFALIIALVAAPMALFAGAWKCACSPDYCTMSCCPDGKCVMQHHEQCQGSSMAFNCDCMRFPSFSMLAPLTQMIPPHPVTMPAVERTTLGIPRVALAVLHGFLPSPFHPPRG
jgi:hypothetical protein